jgi:ribosomal protein S18 acetylase RimI-like enzyme
LKVSVHAATEGDVPLVADLWKTMVEHHRSLVGDRWPVRSAELAWEIRRDQYTTWLREGTGFLLFAGLGDSEAPAGYAACRLLSSGPTFDLGQAYGEIDSLVTAETRRGLGVGTALLEACRVELKGRGVRYWSIGVVEANPRAADLYERLGFRPLSRTLLAPVEPGPEPDSSTISVDQSASASP